MKNKKVSNTIIAILIIFLICFIMGINNNLDSIQEASTENLSNKKICWGIKRNDDNEQPDVGTENRKILEENNRYMLRKYRR